MNQAMQAVFGNMSNTIEATFVTMRIAEEVIAEAVCTKEQGSAAFGVMCPTAPLRRKSAAVYRQHAIELMERVVNGQDTRPGTKVEVLCMMMDLALKAPLNAEGAALADHLFRELFPDVPGMGDPLREFYDGQVRNDLEVARLKLMLSERIGKVHAPTCDMDEDCSCDGPS